MADQLLPILQACLDQDNVRRRAAVKALFEARAVPGFLSALLAVLRTPGVPVPILTQAALQFKNAANHGWKHDPPRRPSSISDEEKAVVRASLVEAAMNSADTAILNAMATPIALIAKLDFPHQWPDFVDQLLKNMMSQDQRRIHFTTNIIRQVFKAFEFARPNQREPFELLIAGLLPALHDMVKALLLNNSLEAAVLLKLAFQSYFSAQMMHLGPAQREPASLTSWMEMATVLAAKELPEASEGKEPAGQPVEYHARLRWPWWKVKKWVFVVLSKFFNRYGHPEYVQEEHMAAAGLFSTTLAPPALTAAMGTLSLLKAGRFVSDRVQTYCLEFVTTAIELDAFYAHLKPHVPVLIWDVILPICSYNENDHRLWLEDPEDYVRRECDSMAAFTDGRTAAKNAATYLLIQLIKLQYMDVFVPFWEELGRRMVAYSTAPPEARNYPEKDGLMVLVGVACGLLDDTFQAQMEPLLIGHVFPELSSPHPFMRARACWLFASCVATVHFTDTANLERGVLAVLELMGKPKADGTKETELPVRFMAAAKFHLMLSNRAAVDAIRGKLGDLMDILFSLMTEMGVDDVVSSLEAIITAFESEMAGVAEHLCQKLIELFQQYAPGPGDEEEEELEMAATNCLECLSTVLQMCTKRPELFPRVEPLLAPLLHHILNPDGLNMEYFDQAISMLSYMAIHAPLTPTMWGLFHLMLQAFSNFAVDFVSEVLSFTLPVVHNPTACFGCRADVYIPQLPIDQFVRRGAEQFLAGDPATGTNFVEMVWGVVVHTEANGGEAIVINGTRVLWSLYYYLHGRIDTLVTGATQHVMKRPMSEYSEAYAVCVCSAVFAAFMYNPLVAQEALIKKGLLGPFCDLVMRTAEHCTVDDDQQVWCLGLSSIFRIPPANMSPELRSRLPVLLQGNVKLLDMLTSPEPGADDGDSDGDGDVSGAAAAAGGPADSHASILAGSAVHASDAGIMGFGMVIPISQYMQETSFAGPANHVHPVVFFHDTMAALATGAPAEFAALTAGLGPAKQLFDEFLADGATLKAEGKAGDLYAPNPLHTT